MASDTWGTFRHDDRPRELHVAPLWKGRPPGCDMTIHEFYDLCWCEYKIEIGDGYFIVIHEEKQRNTFLTL